MDRGKLESGADDQNTNRKSAVSTRYRRVGVRAHHRAIIKRNRLGGNREGLSFRPESTRTRARPTRQVVARIVSIRTQNSWPIGNIAPGNARAGDLNNPI
jgi:hypothetical protein